MNQVIPMKAAALARARDLTASQLALVQRTVAKDTNADEFNMFIEVCKRVGLDPFRRQIYCNVYNKKNPEKRQCVFITGIDGFRAVAARNGNYRPDEDEPTLVFDEAAKDPQTNPLGLAKATVRVYKQDNIGNWHPLVGVARWAEFAPIEDEVNWVEDPQTRQRRPVSTGKRKLAGKWPSMPTLMLAKCAEAQALRRGWPEDLSGVYAPEEMAAAELEDRTATEVIEEEQTARKEALLSHAHTVPVLWHPGDPITFVPDGAFVDEALKFFRTAESPTQIEAWRDTNAAGLREFWGRHKDDALEVKRKMEARIAELEAPAA